MRQSNAARTSRRTYLKAGVVGATAWAMSARSYGRVIGANDRIGVGVIGCGNRGYGAHLPGLHKHAENQNVEITAVCDVWAKHRQRAVQKVSEWFGTAPLEATDYRQLLDHARVDVVTIASCDFQHPRMLRDAAEAGKDAYCEKPLAMDLEELKSVCRAVSEHEIIVQIGTQRRSEPLIQGAREVLQSGVLGKISRIEIFRNAGRPNWYKRLSWLPIGKSEVDWPQFLMDRPQRPFDDLLLAGWYGYREFCGGSIGQFLSHYADLVNYLTGSRFPSNAVAQGATFVWNDEYKFDCRDQVQASFVYPEGFLFTYATNFGNGSGSRSVIYGTEGVLDLSSRPVVSSTGAHGKSKIGHDIAIEPIECPDHFLNWLECLRTREQPIAPIEAGYQHSIACIMADRAMQTGQRQAYDPQSDTLSAG